MKRHLLLIAITVLLLVSVQSFAEYDKGLVVKTMRDNLKLMGEIKKAAAAEKFLEAADHLWAIAQGMRAIRKFDPPRGDKGQWDATMESFISAAYRGIGACGRKNIDGLNEAVTELSALNKQGHGAHKP